MNEPLLSVHGDGKGDFADWFENLGIRSHFLNAYPLKKMVEWQWLIPQFRVVFPEAFFTDQWPTYPELPSERRIGADPVLDVYSTLWDSTWLGDPEDEAFWFLHPFFRPNNRAGALLSKCQAINGVFPTVPAFQHPNGRTVAPVSDYYFHWQGYALIDVIRAADCFRPCLLNTPDAAERATRLAEVTKHVSLGAGDILTLPSRWGGLAEPMTWLSHYRALRSSIDRLEMRNGMLSGQRKRGAVALANHFEILADRLEHVVKEKLLVLAQDWNWAAKQKCPWVSPALENLRTDIFFAVEWLCLLTGNTLDTYLDLWQYTHGGQERWAELKAVLPFEFYSDREYFLQVAPFYLADFNKKLPNSKRLEDARLHAVVEGIRTRNRHFNSFLGSFRKLHEALGAKPALPGGIDFRNRNPLDYYLLLAIRAEQCLRSELLRRDCLGDNDSLELYLRQLAKEIGLDGKAKACFDSHRKTVADLKEMPTDFIDSISRLNTSNERTQIPLGQAMLYCLAARNYFAHHDYLDAELLNEQSSQFLLGGVLLSVLTLLDGE